MPRLALFFLLLSISFPPSVTGDDAGALLAFQQQAAEALEANDVPGAGIALLRDGEIVWAGGIGYADYAKGAPVLGSTRFRIGSVTKVFTALAVLQQVEQGKFTLQTPVLELAAELPVDNAWQESAAVRVAHLLEHTAGFDDMHFRHMNSDDPLPESLAPLAQELGHELTVRWKPGLKHSYSNPGYALAGYLVENSSGQPFHEYVERELLQVLDMRDTRWGVGEEDFAQGYTTRSDGSLRPVTPRAIALYPAGELSSSARDLAKLLQFFLAPRTGERLLSEASLLRMETPRTTRAARHGLENGYGLGNYTSFRHGFILHGHNGGLDGFTAEVAYSREHGFGFVLLLNRNHPGALSVLADMAVEFLARDIERPEAVVTEASAPAAVDGCYRMTNPRNELLHGLEWLVQVTCAQADGERVLLRHPLLPRLVTFEAMTSGMLREAGRQWPNAVFMQDDDLPDAIEWAGLYFERSNRLAVTVPLLAIALALVLMLSSVVFAPVWLLRWRFGSLKGAPAISLRAWPAVASLALFVTLWCATRLELSLLDSINSITLGIFLGGLVFLFATLVSMVQVIRHWRGRVNAFAKWHSLLVALACLGVAVYLIYWQLLPLRLWAW